MEVVPGAVDQDSLQLVPGLFHHHLVQTPVHTRATHPSLFNIKRFPKVIFGIFCNSNTKEENLEAIIWMLDFAGYMVKSPINKSNNNMILRGYLVNSHDFPMFSVIRMNFRQLWPNACRIFTSTSVTIGQPRNQTDIYNYHPNSSPLCIHKYSNCVCKLYFLPKYTLELYTSLGLW